MKRVSSREVAILMGTLALIMLPVALLGWYVVGKHQWAQQQLEQLEPRYARLLGLEAQRAEIEAVKAKAGSGELRNWTAGAYGSYGKVDILMYRERNAPELVPGTSVRGQMAAGMRGAPELVRGVEFMAKSVGTESAAVPRGYLIPAAYGAIVDKLRIHNVKVEVLAKPLRVSGEEFVVDRIDRGRGGDYSANNTVRLTGGFSPSPAREFPAGTFRVDLAQPLANLAFYLLEPQAADGFVGSGVFDAAFEELGRDGRTIVYPVFKYYGILD